MTIAGLWPMLRQRGFIRDVHGVEARELLQGKRVAVDIAFWAVRAIHFFRRRFGDFVATSVLEHSFGCSRRSLETKFEKKTTASR